MADRVVIGSSVAALVAADRLAEIGERVHLKLPSGTPGGGFGPISHGGRTLELGVRLLELSYDEPTPTPALSAYRPGPSGHRPFSALISDYLYELVGARIVAAGRPQMFFEGRMTDDIYFTTDARAVRTALDRKRLVAIESEARACRNNVGYEAGVLAAELSERFADLSLAEASTINQGQTFHDLFMQPIASKIVAGGCADVVASLRRKIWLPLFWPATLSEAAGHETVAFVPDRPFHTISGGGTGALITVLLQRLRDRNVVIEASGSLHNIESASCGRTKMTMSNGEVVVSTKPVIGVSAGELFRAAGGTYRPRLARTVVCWLEVCDADIVQLPSLLSVVDQQIPAVRVSIGGLAPPGRSILTVELRHDVKEANIVHAAKTSIESLELLRPASEMVLLRTVAMPSFPLPTFANAKHFAASRCQFADQAIDAEIVGSGTCFGADSLGEQIVQGLRAAEVLTA